MSSTNIHHGPLLYEQAASQLGANRAGETQRFERLFMGVEVMADGSAVLLAVLSSYFVYSAFHLGRQLQLRHVCGAALVLAVLFVQLLDRHRAYSRGHRLLRIEETERVLRTSAESFLFVFPVTFFTAHLFSRPLLMIAFAAVPLVLLTEKHLLFTMTRSTRARCYGMRNVAVGSAGGSGRGVFSELAHSSSWERWAEYADIDGVLLTLLGTPAPKKMYEVTKRFLDWVAAVFLLLLLSPFVLIIAVLVRLDSPGPVLFKQKRIGEGGNAFQMYKFRSMYLEAPAYAVSPTTSDDPRITPFGRFLRRTSLDELPQLLNVLKGEMSLVGPRPEMPFIVERYNTRHQQRLEVKPGITGLWQLSADRKVHIHENLHYDLYYIRNRSFFMDLAILLHTVPLAMRGV